MKSLVSFAILLLASGCAASAEDAQGSASELRIAPVEHEVISCVEGGIDRGASVRFFAGPDGAILYADYSEPSFVANKLVADMSSCTALTPGDDANTADQVFLSHHCTDMSNGDSYSVDLYEGGLAGVPSIKLFKTPRATGAQELVRSLSCRYNTP
jgi:hypothetical protein